METVVSRRRLLARVSSLAGALTLVGCGILPGATIPATEQPPATKGDQPAAGRGPDPQPVTGGRPTVSPTMVAERSLRLKFDDRTWTVPVQSGVPVGLDPLLASIGSEIAQPARDAHLRITEGGRLEFTPATPGVALDATASAESVRRALVDGRAEVSLVSRRVEPALVDEQFVTARALLERILGHTQGPILTVRGGGRSWTLDRAETAALLAFEFPKQIGGPVAVVLDEQPARAFVQRLATALDREPANARFAWNGGKPTVLREGTPGLAVDQDATVKLFERTLLAAERVLDLPLVPVTPAVSSTDAEWFAGAELIESGSTPLASAIQEKKWNVRLAAERLNGVVVPPGGIFSFNKEVGPTTLEAGFRWGFGITSGAEGIRTVPSVAGGICQVATTLFQPVFWAGYQLEERYWHLYWIPSYTSRGVVGLDVTVEEEARLDFKWINSTKNPVLIQASADDEKVVFQFYGKRPGWRVEVEPARIANRVPPDMTPVTQEDPTLPWGRSIAIEAAREGFDVEVVRRVFSPDAPEPRVLRLKSSYQPSRTVTLIGTAGRPANAAPTAPKPASPAQDADPATPGPASPTAVPGQPDLPRPQEATPAPKPPANPTPLPASNDRLPDGMIRVPGVVGMPEADARALIERVGLRNTYVNYQGAGDVPDSVLASVPPGHVLSQTPVGDAVPPGTVIYLAVRRR
jgi:vancomycin resistance protein YoaR